MPEITYPTRCRIIDIAGEEILPGVFAQTPEASRPHVGKTGTATKLPGAEGVRIVLDDGTVLWGHQCWWEPIDG